MDESVVMSTGTSDDLDYDEYEVNCTIQAVKDGMRNENELKACGCQDCMEALRRMEAGRRQGKEAST